MCGRHYEVSFLMLQPQEHVGGRPQLGFLHKGMTFPYKHCFYLFFQPWTSVAPVVSRYRLGTSCEELSTGVGVGVGLLLGPAKEAIQQLV